MYYLLGIALLLAGVFLTGAGVYLLVMAAGTLFHQRLRTFPAVLCAELMFLLRAVPILGTVLICGCLLIPGFLILEPAATSEHISLRLALLAGSGLILLATVAARAGRLWYASAALRRGWEKVGTRLPQVETSVPVFMLDQPTSVLAVTGILRPRIFISRDVVDRLTPDELRAAIAHELAHVSAADNFKQLLLRVSAPPAFARRAFAALDRTWLAATEVAADEGAARLASRLDLASALVKVARLKAGCAPLAAVASHFIPAEAESELPRRVAGLTSSTQSTSTSQRDTRQQVWLVASLVACVAIAVLTRPAVLSAAHEAMEWLVR